METGIQAREALPTNTTLSFSLLGFNLKKKNQSIPGAFEQWSVHLAWLPVTVVMAAWKRGLFEKWGK